VRPQNRESGTDFPQYLDNQTRPEFRCKNRRYERYFIL
jgi:hypothetical protein